MEAQEKINVATKNVMQAKTYLEELMQAKNDIEQYSVYNKLLDLMLVTIEVLT